jgi:hypothetical protein
VLVGRAGSAASGLEVVGDELVAALVEGLECPVHQLDRGVDGDVRRLHELLESLQAAPEGRDFVPGLQVLDVGHEVQADHVRQSVTDEIEVARRHHPVQALEVLPGLDGVPGQVVDGVAHRDEPRAQVPPARVGPDRHLPLKVVTTEPPPDAEPCGPGRGDDCARPRACPSSGA